MTGSERIAAERQRQIEKEGWTAEHDSKHGLTELIKAALCYADPKPITNTLGSCPLHWPWDPPSWKPTPQNRVRELEKAGALALAAAERIGVEIDRLLALGEE